MPVETHGPEIASHHPIACAGASCRAFPKSIRSCRRKADMPNRVRGQKQKRQPSSGRRFQEAFFHAVRSFTFPIAPLQGRREPSGLRALQVRRELPPPPADPLRTRGTPYRKTSHWHRAKHPPPGGLASCAAFMHNTDKSEALHAAGHLPRAARQPQCSRTSITSLRSAIRTIRPTSFFRLVARSTHTSSKSTTVPLPDSP